MTVGELVALIDLDGTKFEKGVDAAKRSFDGLGSTIERAGKGMLGSLDEFGGKVNKVIMTGLTAGLATGMAAIGYTIAKGFSRLKAIDDARSKLQGLGHDAQTIELVMKNALDSVLGTAFGLDEAATTAAIALASGVKPGQDLERTLRLTADAAAIAKTGMADMSDIFGTVAAAGRLTMVEVHRLAHNGIPILQWLAAEYGVTAAEAKQMVADGEVDFERFRNAIEKNIGGAALAMGDSWSGAFANMGHAAARFGAALIGPIFNQMKGWFHGVIGLLDQATAAVGPWAEDFGERVSDALHDIKAGFLAARGGANSFMGVFEAIGGKAAQVVGWIGQARSALYEVRDGFLAAQGGATGFLGPFERLGGLLSDAYDWLRDNRELVEQVGKAMAIAAPIVIALSSAVNLAGKAFLFLKTYTPIGILFALVSALTYAWQNSEKFRDVVTGAFEKVQEVAGSLLEQVAPYLDRLRQAFTDIVTALTPLATTMRDAFTRIGEALAPVVERVITIYAEIVTSLVEMFAELAPLIVPIIETIVDFIAGMVELVAPVLDQLLAMFQEIWPLIVDVITEAMELILPLLQEILPIILQLFTDVFSQILAVIQEVMPYIQTIIESALNIISGIIKVVTGIIEGDWSAVWEGIKQIFWGVWEGIKSILQLVLGIIQGLLQTTLAAVKGLWETVWGAVKVFFGGIWDTIQSLASSAWSALKSGAQKVWNEIKAAWEALWNGAKAAWEAAAAWIAAIPGKIKDFFADAATWLLQIGKDILNGLWNGMKAIWDEISGWIKDKAAAIKNAFKSALGIGSPSRVMTQIGQWIMEGLLIGLQRVAPEVFDALRTVNARIADSIGVDGAIALPSIGASATIGGAAVVGGVTITGPINIYITGQGREAGEAAGDAFLQRLVTAGVTV